MTCPQLYDVLSPRRSRGNKWLLCRVTGQTCLVDSGDGEHCMRRIWWDGQQAKAVGITNFSRPATERQLGPFL